MDGFKHILSLLIITIILAFNSQALAADRYFTMSNLGELPWDGTSADFLIDETQDQYEFDFIANAAINFTLPWPFEIYGQPYSEIVADGNGNITFVGEISPYIIAFNDNLNAFYAGGVFVENKGDRVVIEWQTETYKDSSEDRPIHFAVVLFSNGDIRFDYKTISAEANINAGDSGLNAQNGIDSTVLDVTTVAAPTSYLFQPLDQDNDGVTDELDAFPDDPAASRDSDGDQVPNEWNEGKDANDSTGGLTHTDAFPDDPAASQDSDGDQVPNDWNDGKDANDSTSGLTYIDDFPEDIAASKDSDDDLVPDSWNDGKSEADSETGLTHLDDFPQDPAASVDADSDGNPESWNDGKTPDDSTSDPKLVLDICNGNDDSGDSDNDQICDDIDNCPGADDLLDSDGDGIADCLDICPNVPNPDQLDLDNNGYGDACEIVPEVITTSPQREATGVTVDSDITASFYPGHNSSMDAASVTGNFTLSKPGIKAIAAGVTHSLVLAQDGSVMAWGPGGYESIEVPSERTDVKRISAAAYTSLAQTKTGELVYWGFDENGEGAIPQGLSDVTAIATGPLHGVALKSDRTVVAWGNDRHGEALTPEGLSDVIAITAGAYHNLALKADKTVFEWGNNIREVIPMPTNLDNVTAIATGYFHNLALTEEGNVVAWGANGAGECNVPSDLHDVVAIAAGFQHSLALTKQGTVIGWGSNQRYQIEVPYDLEKVVAIAAGTYHSLALQADGTVVSWGSDDYGQSYCEQNSLPTMPGSSNIAANVMYDPGTSTATLMPIDPLEPETTYSATITGQNVDGYSLEHPYAWIFETESAAAMPFAAGFFVEETEIIIESDLDKEKDKKEKKEKKQKDKKKDATD